MRGKRAISNIIITLILQVITIICGFVVPKLIISKFGSNVNGLVVSITQFLSYIVLLEAGFGPVIKSILYKPIANKDKEEIKKILKATEKIFRRIAYIFLVYMIILCIVLPIVLKDQFDIMFTFSLIVIIAISVFVDYFFGMTYRLYLQCEQKTYITSLIQIGSTVLNTILIIVLIFAGLNIQTVKLVSAIVFILRPIIQNIYIKKKYNISLKDVKDDYNIKQKWDALAQHIAYVIHNNTDIVILALCGRILEVSVYSVYNMVLNSIRNVIAAFSVGVDASFGDMIAKEEQNSLNNSFKIFEGIYFTVTTILFTATLVLIMPFINLYVGNITDVNYIRPVFSYLIVLASFVLTIRAPYNDLIKTVGHFKQTRKGAIFETVCNLVLSIVLVFEFGLVGVAIGTLVSVFIRLIEFIYYTAKHILKRSIIYSFKRLFVITIEVIIIILIVIFVLPSVEITNYFSWIIYAIAIVIVSSLVVLIGNCIFYFENVNRILEFLKLLMKNTLNTGKK